MLRLSIIIPYLGNPKRLEDTLVSVLENRPNDCEVLAVLAQPYDNPYKLDDEVCFCRAADGTGLAELMNLGIATSRAPVVHLLTCGAEVREGWADVAMAHFRDPQVASVALAGYRLGPSGPRPGSRSPVHPCGSDPASRQRGVRWGRGTEGRSRFGALSCGGFLSQDGPGIAGGLCGQRGRLVGCPRHGPHASVPGISHDLGAGECGCSVVRPSAAPRRLPRGPGTRAVLLAMGPMGCRFLPVDASLGHGRGLRAGHPGFHHSRAGGGPVCGDLPVGEWTPRGASAGIERPLSTYDLAAHLRTASPQ